MMASSADIQKELDTAKAKVETARKALQGATAANFSALTKALSDAEKALKPVQKKYDTAKANEKTAAAGKKASETEQANLLSKGKQTIAIRQDAVDRARSAWQNDPKNQKKFDDYQTKLSELNTKFTEYEGKGIDLGRTVSLQNGQLIDSKVAGVAPAVSPVRATAQMRGEGMGPAATTAASTETITTPTVTPPATSATPAGSSVSTQSATSAKDQKTFVDSELSKRKLKDTPANREKLRKEFQTKNKPVDDMAWMDEFKKTYTAYSDWTTNEVVDHFGQDFVDILKEAVNTEFTDEEIQSRIKGTKYFGAITDSQYKFDGANSAVQNGLIKSAREAIVKDYADVGLTQTDIDEIARKVARNGLTTAGVKQAVYQYAFRKPAAATTPTAPGMARNAIEGGDADAIRIAARAYGYNVSDAEMQAALTGGMYNGVAVTQDSILQKAQKSAKGKYFHLSDQIDAGLSLEDIFSGYRNYAADALEIDPNQIDFTKDSKWAAAFGTKENGQMSLTDWVKTIKTDPNFGWQYTKQANDQAASLAVNLARVFGKVA
jgi:hypothetical protein